MPQHSVRGTDGVATQVAAPDVAIVRMAAGAAEALPARTRLQRLLPHPIVPISASSHRALAEARDRLRDRNLTASNPDPLVERAVNEVTAGNALDNLNYLTGVTSDIRSRNSVHPDSAKAADWLKEQFERFGFETELESFRSDYSPNVIATLKGEDCGDRGNCPIVVIGGHYDSRGRARESATAAAPGANDDGSGTQSLLQLARIIQQASAYSIN